MGMQEESATNSKTLATILIVEDASAMREVVATVLCSRNFTVIEAANGPDALRIAASHTEKIDVLLSDVRLPGMSGLELAEALKESRPEVQVILMSAFGSESVVSVCPWLFLQKPFTLRQLLDKIWLALRPEGANGDTGNSLPGTHQFLTSSPRS